jgi:hypothetical protein
MIYTSRQTKRFFYGVAFFIKPITDLRKEKLNEIIFGGRNSVRKDVKACSTKLRQMASRQSSVLKWRHHVSGPAAKFLL